MATQHQAPTETQETAPYDFLTNDAGEVAVLYSPGFGAGWYTWADSRSLAMLFDRALAEAVMAKDPATALAIAKQKWPDEYHGGVEDLAIAWLKPGTEFRVGEYDGSEHIETGREILLVVPQPPQMLTEEAA